VLRILIAFVSGVATHCFTLWFGGALLDMANLPLWSSFAIAMIAALLVGRYVWLQRNRFAPVWRGRGFSEHSQPEPWRSRLASSVLSYLRQTPIRIPC